MTFRELGPVGAIVEQVRKELLKTVRLLLITPIVVLGCWGGPNVLSVLAQSHPSPSELIQELRFEQTTNNARSNLLKVGKSDPKVRQYLTVHLPPIIESGPNVKGCLEDPCQVWENAVELAGSLKIGEACTALARWIAVKDVNPWPGIHPYGNKLQINPTAISLFEIGDPAVPALQRVLESGSPDEHAVAVGVLCMIQTPKAKTLLRTDLSHESDPDLRTMINTALEKNNP